MRADLSSLPMSGGHMMGAVAIALTAYFVAGPLVAKRTIAMSGWETQCQAGLRASIRREHKSDAPLDAFDCRAIAGQIDPSSAGLCGFFDLLSAPARAAQARAQKLETSRINAALEGVASTCSCAVALAVEEERMSFALYAGSLRLVTPEPVARLQATLDSAARSPKCKFNGGTK
ncbi:hypothetical protein [Roseibium aggregatum]|uniref:hypothetical protein n=1 Tax=Roseibium aggregatum TaxID=187304 RepID=UPI001E2A780D|nr:hypothetical protein [Roseibium aggregatum]UES36697.1 hypothetical protein GFC08_01840 [Roseibium aggregatum]